MNSLQVDLENIHTNSQDLPYGFTTGELHPMRKWHIFRKNEKFSEKNDGF